MMNDRAAVLAQLRQRVASDDVKMVIKWLECERDMLLERLANAPIDMMQNLQGRVQQCANLRSALTRADIDTQKQG